MKPEQLERFMDWCDEHEKLILLAMGIATLILGPVFYCLAANGGFNWLMTPLAGIAYVMNWFCSC